MLRENLEALFDLYGQKFVNDLIDRMNELNLNATGNAAKNLRYEAASGGFRIIGDRYLTAVDAGRPRGRRMPPRKALEAWIEAKVAPGLDQAELKSLSFAIARSIAKNGTIKRFGYRGADLIDFIINKNINSLTADAAQEALDAIGEQLELKAKTYKDIIVR